MKKNIFLFMVVYIFANSFASASDKIHVTALESFNTASPSTYIDVSVMENAMLGEYELKENDVLHCRVVKVTDPKRGKRAASFSVSPISYTSDGVEKQINGSYCGKYADKILSKEELRNIDAAKVGKKAAITVGNHFVKGVAPIASLAEGMIKNEDGNRIESGVKKVYKDSALSYVEKGSEIKITPGAHFYLIFKSSTSEGEENAIESSED